MAEQYDGSIRLNTKIETRDANRQMQRLADDLKKTAQDADGMRKKMAALAKTKIPTAEYAEIQKQISQANSRLNKLIDAQDKFVATGGKKRSTTYRRYEYDIEDLTKTIKYAKAELQDLEDSGKAFTTGDMSEEYREASRALEVLESRQTKLEGQLEKSLQKERQKQAQLRAQAAEEQRLIQIKENASVSDQKMVDLLARRKQLQAEINELEKAGVTAGYAEYDAKKSELGGIESLLSDKSSVTGDLSSTLTQLAAIAGKVNQIVALAGVGLTVVKKAGAAVKNLASGIYRIVSNIVQKIGGAFNTLGALSAKFFSRIISGFKRSGKSTGDFRTRLQSLLKSVFIFSVIRSGFQSMVSGVQDSTKKFTQYSALFNENVSSLVNALNTLKNAITGAFTPILNVAIPALTQLINYVTRAVNMVSQLIAALTGKSTWSRAVSQTEDYAASLDGVASSAKKAQGALAKFDDLDVLNQDTSGGAGGAGGSGSDLWEEVPVSDAMKNMADWLKKMWEAADFYDLGALLGEKLKEALDNIPWDGIKESARKIGKSIASLINGFIEVEGLGESIGRTLAEALNTAFEFLNAFVHELHWDSVGKFIVETISGFFNNIDWALIYDTFITGAQGLADAVNSFADNFDWNVISTTVGNFVNTFVDTIYTFFAGVEWGRIGDLIGQQISAALNNIDFAKIGETFSTVLMSLLEFFLGIIESIQWSQIAASLAAAFTAIDWKGLTSTLLTLIVEAINGAVEAVKIFLLSIDWGSAAKTLGENLSAALSEFDWGNAGKAFGAGINAIVDVVLGFVSGLDIAGIAEGLGQWLNSAIKQVDAEKLGDAIEGVVNTVLDLLIGFMEEVDWAQVGDKIEEAFTSIDGGQIAAKIGEVLKLAFSAVIVALPEWVKNIGSSIIDGIGAGLLSGEGLLQTISGALFQGLLTFIKELLGIHSPSTVFQEIGGNLVEGLLLGIQETWLLLQEWFVTTFETLILFFTEKWTAIKDGATEIWTLLKDTLAEIWTNIQDKASEVFSAVKDKLSEVWDSIKLKIDTKVKEIKTKVEELLKKFTTFKDDASKAFETVKTNIINALTPVIEKIQSFITWIQTAIDKVKEFFNVGGGEVGSPASKTSKSSSARSTSLTMAMQQAGIPSVVDAQSVVRNIPHLASGAVIRGGKPFAAILGDQPAGQTNVEAPLPLFEKAVENVLERRGYNNDGTTVNIALNYDGETFARLSLRDIFAEAARQGYDVDLLGWNG